MSALIQAPSVGEGADGWTVTSSSRDQPSPEQIVARLNETPEPETPAVPAAEPETPAAVSAEPAAPDDATTAEAPKKKQSASERIAELRARINAETRGYHEARQAREAEEAQLQKLRADRESLAAKPAEPELPADKPVWSQYEEDGKSYDQFLDDRDSWNRRQWEQSIQAREQEQRTQYQQSQRARQQQDAESQHGQRITVAMKEHADFMDLVNQNLSDIPETPFVTDVVKGHEQGAEVLYYLAQHPDEARVLSTLQPSRPLRDAIRYSDIPQDLLSYLAQQPQECDRLSRLHPAPALVALGEITAQLKGAKTGTPAAETVSHAKPPTRHVAGARPGAQKAAVELPFGPSGSRQKTNASESKG